MKRRWIIIGTLLICVLTLLVVALKAPRVLREQQAITALKGAGAVVLFDYQSKGLKKPQFVPEWVRSFAGDCPFANVESVMFLDTSPADDEVLLPLSELPDLRHVAIHGNGVTDRTAHFLSQITTLESVNFTNTFVTGKGLKEMSRCTQLESLTLSGVTVSDDCIEGLREWPALNHLQVVRARISSKGLESISSILPLKRLDLWEAGTVDDKGLEHLEQLRNLQSLFVINAPITNAGLRSCGAMKQLRFLRINSPEITDDGLESLRKLSHLEVVGFQESAIQNPSVLAELPLLRELDLSGTNVSDSGVESLSKSRSIKSLSLHSTGLTDSSLQHLASLKTLQELDVGPHINESAVQMLHLALPRCRISIIDETGIYKLTLRSK